MRQTTLELHIAPTTVDLSRPELRLEIGAIAGPRGHDAEGVGGAHGTIPSDLLVWPLVHNLDQPEEELNPSTWWFTDHLGNPMEPEALEYVTNNAAIAIWGDTPVRGSWVVS